MRYIFKFPDIGEGLEEGKIIEWYVDKGSTVESGDPIVKMETDKVVTDIPSPKSGVISVRYGGIGDTVKVGSALVEIDIEGINAETAQEEAKVEPKAASTESVDEEGFGGVVGTIEVAGDGAYLPAGEEGISVQKETKIRKKALATPVARAMAKDLDIDINQVQGTGPAGRVTKKDVQSFRPSAQVHSLAKSNQEATSERISFEPLSQIRKTIAKNMLRSKQNTAHMSIMDEVEISELVNARTRLNELLGDSGIRLTYLPFVIKAIALALKQHPVLNAELDMENERIINKNYINMGIAMDTEDGLVVPVIRDADKKSLSELAAEIKSLAGRAQDRKLTLDDLKDGTFSITSYGSIGGYFAVPVIAYPQVAIFGIGKITQKPVIKDNQIVIGNVMPISMSVDHRIVDGAEVSRFVNKVLGYLKEPMLLIV